ncbi:MAG: non-ribosomal peptide synthetase, partial [Thermoplasmatota archaeon]
MEGRASTDGAATSWSAGGQGAPDAGGEAEIPLSAAQESLWTVHQMEDPGSAYNLLSLLEFEGPLDLAALRGACADVLERHPHLRGRVKAGKGGSLSLVVPPFSRDAFALPVQDVRAEDLDAEVAKLSGLPNPLETGPLIRYALFRLDPRRHALFVGVHHLVFDYPSWLVVRKDLADFYSRRCAASGAGDGALTVAADPAWRTPEATGPEAAAARKKAEEFWKAALPGDLAPLELPRLAHGDPGKSARVAAVRFSLGQDLHTRLHAACAERGVSMFTVVVAALGALFRRYGTASPLAVSATASTRDRAAADAVGYHINLVPIVFQPPAEATLAETIALVDGTARAALRHRTLPLRDIVRLAPQLRGLAANPLLQTILTYVNRPPFERTVAPGTVARDVHIVPNVHAIADLALHVFDGPSDALVDLEYKADEFDGDLMRRMMGHYRLLLEAVAASPDTPVAELPLLAEDERRQVVVEWNGTAAEYPRDARLHDLFEAQARRTPDAVAVRFGDAHLTYAQLDRRANQLAHYLQGLGVGHDSLVGICVERGLEMLVGLLGILKAGAAYVPLDPAYPAERVAFMAQDAAFPVLLTQESLRNNLPPSNATVLCLDSQWSSIARHPVTAPPCRSTPESLAYILYTSGSTGKPKGVLVHHQGVVNNLSWMQATFGLTGKDRVLQKTSFCFDVSGWELFWPILNGACIVVARQDGQSDPDYLMDLVEREGVTTIQFVPTMLTTFLNAGRPERCRSLKRVLCAGEALPPALVERFHASLQCELHNLYGPTEASINVSHWPCPTTTRNIVPIGRPIANTQLYVLDAHRN